LTAIPRVIDRATLEPAVTAEPPTPEPVDGDDIDEAIIVRVSDYLDGALTGAERAEVAQHIATDPTWKRAHAELTETRQVLSGLRTAHVRSGFAEDVAETIHQRSAGRLFGRRTVGDRVPFRVLVIVALAGLAVIGYILWSSSTGSLKVDHDGRGARPGSAVVPPP
jgi:anti-sigma factor RsiW